jgi:hypothetical protein
LEIFKQNNVKLVLHKAEWCKKEVEFLGVIVGENGVHMLEDKIRAVLE